MSATHKIIHVVPTLGAGGTEQNGARLAKAFDGAGSFENHIVANFLGDESFRAILESVSVSPVKVLPHGRGPRLKEFLRYVRQVGAGTIVFHFINIDQALLSVAARRAGATRLVAAAGTGAVGLSTTDRLKWNAVIGLNWVTRTPVVSASRWIESTIEQTVRLPARSRVVHNGLDMERFRLARSRKPMRDTSNGRWTLGMVARLEGAKDHQSLIRGFGIFVSHMPEVDAELRIIGDGPLRHKLVSLVSQLGLQDKILFLGTRLDIPEQLAELDAFVFSTTLREGFGNVLVEALAAGVPVIANDVPSSREALRDGEFGTLLEGSGAEAWAVELSRSWANRGSVHLPNENEIDDAYGIAQFRDGYLQALGLANMIRK